MPAGPIAVTGSIATDHLMHFPGRFRDQLIAERLDRLSLSFLVDDLEIRRGGVAANIAFSLGVLGRRPVLVGAVGADFADYRSWLERHGVDCGGVLTVEGAHTPRFTCTTDDDQCQIASFYPGAMAASAGIDLAPVVASRGVSLVLVGASAPDAMLAHTAQAHRLGVPVAADPSQQLPRLDRDECRALVDGAAYLFTNEYEWELLLRRTGWSEREVTDRVGMRITTLGDKGARIAARAEAETQVDAVPARRIVDPTGVGDAFRAGFLAGLDSGLPVTAAAQLASLVATAVLESVGGQEWTLTAADARERLTDAYGPDAAAAITPHLRSPRAV
ncbi:carbohydrate kinase family protein [Phytohabitans suffuscus]|uniref:Adenosine kinase n=1 Tax=Phytohabitans suffuscus TaxID=624315 RepID=A0A6F8YY31_9ACTN|nr:carbohydrate kinase family protein [Phytohabitans suffuscus]BCB90976.1 adenosine kinase [Phytohabitans suffuscus]